MPLSRAKICLAAASTLAALALAGCGDSTREDRLQAAGPNPDLPALLAVANVEMGARKFSRCSACHQIQKGGRDLGGPNLYGIFNNPVAHSSERFGFTASLRDSGLIWDAATLDHWMQDPKQLVPATSMQFGGVPDALDRADIIAFIQSRSDEN